MNPKQKRMLREDTQKFSKKLAEPWQKKMEEFRSSVHIKEKKKQK